jgi:hypothetical protein
MRLQQDSLTKTKNYVHAAQAFVILLSWILTIAVYVASGSTDGRTSWFFALVSNFPYRALHSQATTANPVP